MAIPIKGRISQKHDIEANWLKATNFIPMQGEIIVYDIDSNYTYERFKIGDGIKTVNNLPFTVLQPDWVQTDTTKSDYIKNKPDFEGLKSRVTQVEDALKVYTATYDGIGTIFGTNAHLYTVTIDNKFTGESVSEESLINYKLLVKFEDTTSNELYPIGLKINNSNYYMLGGISPGGDLCRPRSKFPYKGSQIEVTLSLIDTYDTTSPWRCLWRTEGMYSLYSMGGNSFAQAVAIAKGGTGATTAASALENLGAASKTELEAIIDDTQSTETNTWSSSKITSYIEETFLGGAW